MLKKVITECWAQNFSAFEITGTLNTPSLSDIKKLIFFWCQILIFKKINLSVCEPIIIGQTQSC